MTRPRPASASAPRSYRSGATTYAYEHRAFARLDRRGRAVAEAVGLAVVATAAWVAAMPTVARLWGHALNALASGLGVPADTVLRVHDVWGWEVAVAHWSLEGALPGLPLVALAGVGTLVGFVLSLFVPERWRPGVYLLRAVLIVQASAVLYFALWPERLPYTLADYLHGMMATGLVIATVTPAVLGLTFYIQDLRLAQKAGFTVLALGYSVVLVPLQYALHGVALAGGTLLWMPVLYLFFGVPLHVFALVALYAWAMSWPGRQPALGIPAPPAPEAAPAPPAPEAEPMPLPPESLFKPSPTMPQTPRSAVFHALAGLCLLGGSAVSAQTVDLSLSMTASASTVEVGDDVTFWVTVTNPSNSHANGVEVTVPLPAGFSFRSATGGTYAESTGLWNAGRVNKNKSETLTIVAMASSAGTWDASGEITGFSGTDPNGANDAASVTVGVTAPIVAGPGVCYAVADNGGANGGDDWLVITSRDGASQAPVGIGTGTSTIEAAAYWPGTDVLYAANAGALGTLDVSTGAFATIGAFGTAGNGGTEVDIGDVDGLAFDPFTGRLYGAHRREGTTNLEDLLVVIDPATGAHVPEAFGPGLDYVVIASAAAPTSQPDIDDLAIDPYDGTLYAIANGTGPDRLIAIDRATGAVTDIGALGQADMEGLAFDATGGLFGSTGSVAATNANALFSVDKATGAATLMAALDEGSDHEAVACLTDGVNAVTGTLFNDTDADGAYALGTDTPEAGRTVTLYRDVDGSGDLSPGDVAVATASTDAAGDYAFTVAASGDFVVATEDLTASGGAYTTSETHAASFAGFGATASGLDIGYTTSTDLAISMTVSDPAPSVGDVVTFTITLTNQGVLGATDVQVSAPFLARADTVAVVGSTPSAGTYDGTLWVVGDLGVGETRTLTVQVRLDQDLIAFTALAEIARAAQSDTDSTPYNGVTSEDDYASATATTGGASTAGEGGLESDGSMAQAIAHVLYGRRAEAAERLDRGEAPRKPLLFSEARTASGTALGQIVPRTGPAGSVAVEVSPTDLLPVTNAREVVAADYLRPDGRRVGAVFATATAAGEVYEHTKPVCDRLRGGVLTGVELVEVAGRPFVLTRLRQADGSVDYAVSFVVYGEGAARTVDSRFLLHEYDLEAMRGDADVLNLQVWGPSREYAVALVAASLAGLSAEGDLRFRNEGDAAPAVPAVFVQSGRYEAGRLVLDVYNAAGATSLRLTGGTMTRAEGTEATSFERTVALDPGTAAAPVVTVAVETGYLFDAAFFVETDKSAAPDRLYLADGTWGVALDPTSEAARLGVFEVAPETAPTAGGTRRVERPVRVVGQTDTWATLYRTLQPGGLTVDLSGYRYVEFEAAGSGEAHLLLQQASIATSDHYGTAVPLTPEFARHRVWFDDLRLADGSRGFEGHDVVTLSLTLRADGAPVPFDLAVRNLRFGGAEGDAEAAPAESVLLGAAPNPFAASTRLRFELAEAGAVRLRVFDALGREVARPVDGEREAGRHAATFSGSGLAAGVYVVRLETGDRVLTQRMTLVR